MHRVGRGEQRGAYIQFNLYANRHIQEMHLLNLDTGTTMDNVADEHEVATAPLLTRAAYDAAGLAQKKSQYGVLGSVTSIW